MAKVLCIDDDVDVVETCESFLKEEGHTVEKAYNSKEGLSKAKSFKPDLILLDVMMESSTDGFHVAYGIRQDNELRYTPILMLTSVNQKMDMKFDPKKDKEFLPVDAFVEKPIVRNKVMAKVNELLALSKDQINVDGSRG